MSLTCSITIMLYDDKGMFFKIQFRKKEDECVLNDACSYYMYYKNKF